MASNRNPAGEGAVDLTTRYMGLALKNPLIASASPLTGEVGKIRQIEDTGAAAVVLPSVFEEQIEQEVQEYERLTSMALDSFPEVASFFPEPSLYNVGPHQYLMMPGTALGLRAMAPCVYDGRYSRSFARIFENQEGQARRWRCMQPESFKQDFGKVPLPQ